MTVIRMDAPVDFQKGQNATINFKREIISKLGINFSQKGGCNLAGQILELEYLHP